MFKCIESNVVERIGDYTISREVDRKYDPMTGEYSGNRVVWYSVNFEDEMLECFKAIKEARKYIAEQ